MATGPYEAGGLCVNYKAEGAAIEPFRIVKFGTADKTVVVAAAAADLSIGVTSHVKADADMDCDVWRSGIRRVVYGGAVTKGDQLTAAADGKAVVAATGNRVIGIAEITGVADDIGSVCITPSVA